MAHRLNKSHSQGFTKSSIIVPISSLIGVFVFFWGLQIAKVGYFDISVRPMTSNLLSKKAPAQLPSAIKTDIKTYDNYIFSTYSVAEKWAITNICSSITTAPSPSSETSIFATPQIASQAATALPYNSSPSLSNLDLTNASSLSIPKTQGFSIPQYCAIGIYSKAKLPGNKQFGSNVYSLSIPKIGSESSTLLSPNGITIPLAFEIGIRDQVMANSTPTYRHIFVVVELSGHYDTSSNSVVLDSAKPKILGLLVNDTSASLPAPSYIKPNATFVLPAGLKLS